jgi:hypothetical protein
MATINQPLSNVQLEILKAFNHNLSDSELQEFRQTLALFFAHKAIKKANEVWEEEGWNDEKVENILKIKMRRKLH